MSGVGAAAFTVLLMGALALLLRFPPISDVSTTPEDPPAFPAGSARAAQYPPAFADLQRRAYPELAPLETPGDPDETFARAAAAARGMPGWEVVVQDDSLRVLQAAVPTRLLRSSDDVVIQVRPADGGSEVHVRSRSRLGRMDFGTNARRIGAYLQLLQ